MTSVASRPSGAIAGSLCRDEPRRSDPSRSGHEHENRLSAPLACCSCCHPCLDRSGPRSSAYRSGGGLGGPVARSRADLRKREPALLCAGSGDLFGYALAAGDFNGDGAEDLATGIPLDDGHGRRFPIVDMGAVVVRYGIPGMGLETGLADTYLSQLAAGNPDGPRTGDRYGWRSPRATSTATALTTSRLECRTTVPRRPPAARGAVEIHYGLPKVIQLAAEHLLRQGTTVFPGADERLRRSLRVCARRRRLQRRRLTTIWRSDAPSTMTHSLWRR